MSVEIEFNGLSLEAFAKAEEQPRQSNGVSPSQLEAALQPRIIEDYAKEKDQFEDLHTSISACDKVLDSVETYLKGFQADLGTVSAEIETLQNRSTEMNTRLENRKVVEKLLGSL